jgi:hypothetical protein
MLEDCENIYVQVSGEVGPPGIQGPVGPQGPQGEPGSSGSGGGDTSKVRSTFSNSDLIDGVLTITHNFGLITNYAVAVTLIDENDQVLIPDNITCFTNTVEIELVSMGTLSGTWKYLILG